MAAIINIIAWVLCFVVGFLLLGDFIRTEMHFAKKRKEEASKKEVAANESAE